MRTMPERRSRIPVPVRTRESSITSVRAPFCMSSGMSIVFRGNHYRSMVIIMVYGSEYRDSGFQCHAVLAAALGVVSALTGVSSTMSFNSAYNHPIRVHDHTRIFPKFS